jgi:hypothetical protein
MGHTINDAVGRQAQFNRALLAVHYLAAIAFSVKAIAGVIVNVSGLAIIGALAGIIVSDITIFYLVNSWQARELVGEQKTWSYILYALSMGDVFSGAVAASVGWGGAYYAWGMWAMLAMIFVCYVVIAVGVSPIAIADEREKLSDLEAAQAEHGAMIAERRNRASAKLLKAREAEAVREARWRTMHTFYNSLMMRPQSWGSRRQISRKAKIAFATLLGEIDDTDVSRQLPSAAAVREVVIEPSGDGHGSFR